MRLTRKVPATFAGIALACCLGVGAGCYLVGANLVRSQAETRLLALAESRKDTVLSAWTSVRSLLVLQAQSKTVREAVRGLTKGDTGTSLLKLNTSVDPYPALKQYAGESGLQDFLLVTAAGRVVHSTRKLPGFTNDLRAPDWQGSNLAKAFEAAIKGKEGHAYFFDLQAYPANSNRPTSFISAPVIEGGTAIGALIRYVPTEEISSQLAGYDDLGDTGNVFLVNENGLVQNDSLRTTDVSELLYSSLSRREVTSVLGKTRSSVKLTDFQGVDAQAAIVPFDFQGRNYAVVVTQDVAEIEAPLSSLMKLILGVSLFCTLAAALIGFRIAREQAERINRLSRALSQIADGDPAVRVSVRENGDEIDDMARIVASFRSVEFRRQQLEVDRWSADEASDRQAKRVKELVDRFIEDVTAA